MGTLVITGTSVDPYHRLA